MCYLPVCWRQHPTRWRSHDAFRPPPDFHAHSTRPMSPNFRPNLNHIIVLPAKAKKGRIPLSGAKHVGFDVILSGNRNESRCQPMQLLLIAIIIAYRLSHARNATNQQSSLYFQPCINNNNYYYLWIIMVLVHIWSDTKRFLSLSPPFFVCFFFYLSWNFDKHRTWDGEF